jgi:hypothetical protein
LASKSFVAKNYRTSKDKNGYSSFEMDFPKEIQSAVDSTDYSMAFSCKKKTDPTSKFGSSGDLIASIDYNHTKKYDQKIGASAESSFGKLVAFASAIPESDGARKLSQCFKAAAKRGSKVSNATSRFDMIYEDKNGNQFLCFQIVGAKWSSYGISINTGFDFKSAKASE